MKVKVTGDFGGEKVGRIKQIRALLGIGLKEAKDFVEFAVSGYETTLSRYSTHEVTDQIRELRAMGYTVEGDSVRPEISATLRDAALQELEAGNLKEAAGIIALARRLYGDQTIPSDPRDRMLLPQA